jgi:rRNA-processing protein FCF1
MKVVLENNFLWYWLTFQLRVGGIFGRLLVSNAEIIVAVIKPGIAA